MTTTISFYESENLVAYRLFARISEAEMDEQEGICVFNNAMKLSKLANEPVILYRRRGSGRLAMSLDELNPDEFIYKGIIEWMAEKEYNINYID